MTRAGELLERGREAFGGRRWTEAYERLEEADAAEPLGPDDLGLHAAVAFLLGRDAACIEIWTRCHQQQLSAGDVAGAARCTFWLGFVHINRGEFAPAMGWFGRGQRLLDDAQLDCVERGYLLMPAAIQQAQKGDAAAALDVFVRATEIGERFGEPDLVAKTRVGQGRCLIKLERVSEGLALMDEAMTAAVAGDLSAVWIGDLYCTVVEGCFEAIDLRRAQEWTAELTRWCDSQPDLVPFRGQCLVHRAELKQLNGTWPDALLEARQACERLMEHPMLGAAYYQLGELHRLRGELDDAEGAYRQANEHGRDPQPGLALLRLARGRTEAARASIGPAVESTEDRLARSRLLGAFVEILLAAGAVEEARGAADELAKIAADLDAPLLRAAAEHANGAVLLAEGDAAGASGAMRRAWKLWRDIDAPYEAARARVVLALACRQAGDEDTAAFELEAALREFGELGARLDVERVEELRGTKRPEPAGGLTTREREVIALVAEGKTNRAIAEELVISERTIARHVSNIFVKLGVSTRAAATAYAYEHDLV